MQLLDRYLNAVRFWLPAAQQDDIIAELNDDLRAEIGDRESLLGHSLSEAELSAIIKRRGDPVVVAFNFLDMKPLIGPALLPIYWYVVQLVTLWVLIPVFTLIVGPIETAQQTNPGLGLAWTLWHLGMAQVFAFGTITIVFAILERSDVTYRALGKSVQGWDPAKLPSLPLAIGPNRTATPRSTAIAEIVAGAIAGIWIIAVLWSSMQVDLNNVQLAAAPIWKNLRWLIPVPCLTGVAVGWFSLVHPYSTRAREWFRAGIDSLNLILLGILLAAGQWVVVHSSVLAADAASEAAHWANFGIRIGLGVGVMITGYSLVSKILNLTRTPSKAFPSATPRRA
jgi:hypothetical protein